MRVILSFGLVKAISRSGKDGNMQNPRLTHILSHKEQDSECFSLQWEVEDTAALHRWHTQQGMHLNEEMMKIFKDKWLAFPL